jgi:hypothetical protein
VTATHCHLTKEIIVMKSFITRGLVPAALAFCCAAAHAQPSVESLYSTRASDYHLAPHSGSWEQSRPADDTVSCMALGCTGSGYGHIGYPAGGIPHRGPVVELPGRELSEEEIGRRLKDDEPEAAPRARPATEWAARDEYYKRLGQHADGKGTIEQVEEAYGDLIQFRR